MANTDYTECATRPEEIVMCSVLEAGNYPELYSEKVKSILGIIKEEDIRKKVESNLGTFESREEMLAQSSPYRLVVLQEILPKGKVLVARPRLQTAKANNPNFMAGFYVDCGLNLVSGEQGYQVNPVQAEELAKDLEDVGINLTNPKLIPYNALTYNINPKSPNGLVFKLSEQGKDNAKALVLNTLDFKWDYLPSNNGLFRAYFYRNGIWGADDGGLADSSDLSRVVVETNGYASAKNFEELKRQSEELLNRQRQERDNLVKRLQA